MSRQIIKQPNGLYAVWSTNVDDFIIQDATEREIVDELLQESKLEIIEQVSRVISKLECGEKPYGKLTLTYEDAIRIARSLAK